MKLSISCMGLPTETDEDVLAIAELANRVVWTWRHMRPTKTAACGSR